ncbi:MAG: dihydroorotase [Bacteroidetes bacterium]|jgi:dihydroorotase|nr:dihydroorotase [Bacteroidota bacterium]
MNILIKSAKIVDSSSDLNGKKFDILIERGIITEIKATIKNDKGYKTVESPDLCVSPGWIDMQARFCDPGFEFKEDLESGVRAAAGGGFTAVCIMPGTEPPLHTKSQIEYVVNKTKDGAVDVYPIGTLTQNREGKDIAEMHDMKLSGAVAFSDDKRPVKDSGLLLRALQYASNVGALVIAHNEDKSLSHGGQMHEGEVSTRIGLKGIPAIAEELMLQRNLQILEYTDARLHVSAISTKGSVDLLKRSKAEGLKVTAAVAAHNLLLDDTKVFEFDTNYKVNPPLRAKEDLEALKKGLLNNTIDVIVSDHTPEDTENKELEFDLASNGIIALETAYAAANTACHAKLSQDHLVEKLCHNPRKILGLEVPVIREGEAANLTLFDPSREWTFEKKNILSKSKNTPFVGYKFKGKVVGIVNKNEFIPTK